MNLFDRLVQQAMNARPELTSVIAVVEKELLHHDILREMSAAGLLAGMTFIGGTCLRACYGSPRLSEDLDFTGGKDFTRETLSALAGVLVDRLEKKYALMVKVDAPVKETSGVDTWKMTVLTYPGRRDLPPQRIHIDICAIPSHDSRPMMLRNFYGVDMGTSGLIIQAQSREELLADKLLALAFRPNRIKNRDLWDITWLKQQGIEMPLALIPSKIADHRRGVPEFTALLRKRTASLKNDPGVRTAFVSEMQRFLPSQVVAETVEKETFWAYLVNLVCGESTQAIAAAERTER
ncbi:MAG: nucleotidyl transferase AbiEii/AbiGii toxin family protein [bacterium]